MDSHYDVLIIGAGLSGIGAACHLINTCPGRSFRLVEARSAIGGTWDLFRYPGIRSDSDMHTFGFAFRPWTNPKAIADGPEILAYLNEVTREYGIRQHIDFNRRAMKFSWSSTEGLWHIETRDDAGRMYRYTANTILACSGYYRYEAGYTPKFKGLENFRGRFVHPQKWTDDIDYKDKKVVVIGSGATAVTLVPSMAGQAEHVTMLQRSPTYVTTLPRKDKWAERLTKWLPGTIGPSVTRWRNAMIHLALYNFSRRYPERTKAFLLKQVRRQLGPDYDVETHFTPNYNPWDQRLCLVPDSDLFRAIRSGDASVVTDTIDHFTPTGIALTSGQELEADLVVSATGLHVQFLGGATVEVDGEEVDVAKCMTFKGMMLTGIPNFAFFIGYTNASWTLKVDLTCAYMCRLLNYMEREGYHTCVPMPDPAVAEEPLLDLSSGYIKRASGTLPRGGAVKPWRLYQNYLLDTLALRYGKVDDDNLRFTPLAQSTQARNRDSQTSGA